MVGQPLHLARPHRSGLHRHAGSGFGRIIGAGTRKDFWGVDEDVAAFGQFIQRYITNFNRWNSPRFLFGESYGTTRSSVLAKYLQNEGISLNGVVLLSSFLNSDIDYNDGAPIGGGDWGYVLYLADRGRDGLVPSRVAGFARAARRCFRRSRVRAQRVPRRARTGRDARAGSLQRRGGEAAPYTGLSEQYIRNSNLRIPYDRFENELLRERGVTIGRIDARFQTTVLDRPEVSPDWDATDAAIDSAFTSTGNYYLRQTLKYNTPLLYRANIYDLIYADGETWDFKHGPNAQSLNVTPDLAQAMTYNPNLKVFSANGYFDFATPFFATFYALNHLNLAPSVRRNITFGFYESGHMVYLHPTALKHFHDDLERWYAGALNHA